MRNRLFRGRIILQIPDPVHRPVSVIARQRTCDGPCILRERSPYKGVVCALRRMLEELPAEIRLRVRSFGYQQQARRILVYPMNQPNIGIIHVKFLAEVVRQSIQQRVFEVPVSGMHHESGRLVNHQHILVLIHHIDRHFFRRNRRVNRLIIRKNLNLIQWLDLVI